jgi:hypothetical protein
MLGVTTPPFRASCFTRFFLVQKYFSSPFVREVAVQGNNAIRFSDSISLGSYLEKFMNKKIVISAFLLGVSFSMNSWAATGVVYDPVVVRVGNVAQCTYQYREATNKPLKKGIVQKKWQKNANGTGLWIYPIIPAPTTPFASFAASFCNNPLAGERP